MRTRTRLLIAVPAAALAAVGVIGAVGAAGGGAAPADESPNPPAVVTDEEKGAPAGPEPADHQHEEPATLEGVREAFGADEDPNVIVEDNGDGTFQVTFMNPADPDTPVAVPSGKAEPLQGSPEESTPTAVEVER
jgi:hypothetical protein